MCLSPYKACYQVTTSQGVVRSAFASCRCDARVQLRQQVGCGEAWEQCGGRGGWGGWGGAGAGAGAGL